MLVVDYLYESEESSVRGAEENAMREHPFLKDVMSGMGGELALMRG